MKRFVTKGINPLKFFITDSRSIGVLLLLCTAFSLLMSNTSGGGWYRSIWNADVPSILNLPHSPLKWINDFLMAFFFFFAGMEIKRELIAGELSSLREQYYHSGLLWVAWCPALIFLAFNTQSDLFTVGEFQLRPILHFHWDCFFVWKESTDWVKIFLMALAIIDDLGAIIVIALFYGGKVESMYLIIAAILYGLLWLCNYVRMKPGLIQLIISLLLWYAILNSGIEASITGVLVAFTMPVYSLVKLEKIIHGVVNFFILPFFALANTAVLIPGDISSALNSSIAFGITAGLVIGKPVGIFLFSRILVALKIAKLPGQTYWKQFVGMGTLAGIGFTMSIFTTTLAFNGEVYRDIAKIAILLSMILSVIVSWLYFLSISNTNISKSLAVGNDPEMALG
jgi:NhaA family Na+:H+ antiporter